MARRFYSTSRPIAAIGAIDKPARPADSAVESERRTMKFPPAVVRVEGGPPPPLPALARPAWPAARARGAEGRTSRRAGAGVWGGGGGGRLGNSPRTVD